MLNVCQSLRNFVKCCVNDGCQQSVQIDHTEHMLFFRNGESHITNKNKQQRNGLISNVIFNQMIQHVDLNFYHVYL